MTKWLRHPSRRPLEGWGERAGGGWIPSRHYRSTHTACARALRGWWGVGRRVGPKAGAGRVGHWWDRRRRAHVPHQPLGADRRMVWCSRQWCAGPKEHTGWWTACGVVVGGGRAASTAGRASASFAVKQQARQDILLSTRSLCEEFGAGSAVSGEWGRCFSRQRIAHVLSAPYGAHEAPVVIQRPSLDPSCYGGCGVAVGPPPGEKWVR